MRITIITAGGAGMYCGSCMHDNSLARALIQQGCDTTLLPTYTPIRVDEPDQTAPRVFLGGVGVYLAALSPVYRWLPRGLTRWLDAPWVLKLASRMGVSNNARELGELTVSLLSGEHGPHRAAIVELAEFLKSQPTPDVICLSNTLLAGVLPTIREMVPSRVFGILQGDDIFLNGLVEPYRERVLRRLHELSRYFDGYLTHSAFYADSMSQMLGLPRERMHVVPLAIDVAGHAPQPIVKSDGSLTLGYMARICPEKGLHLLVDAFRRLRPDFPHVTLRAAGYLGPRDADYMRELVAGSQDLGEHFQYVGSPQSLPEKIAFLQSLDVLSVPTTYAEPKGLFVLEAWANGIPVVQPAHGSFPEMLSRGQGGLLCQPHDAGDLAEKLAQLLRDPKLRQTLGATGHTAVRTHFTPAQAAASTLTAVGLRPKKQVSSEATL